MPTVLVCLAVSAWFTLDIIFSGPLRGFDHAVATWIAGFGARQHVVSEVPLWVLSQFGGRATIVICMSVLVIYLARSRRTWQPVFRLLAALALLTIVVYAFKLGIGRTAPSYLGGADLLHTSTGQSYPSGHTANAVLMWGLAAWLASEYGMAAGWVRFFRGLAAAAGVVASLAMLVLNYHWLTDLVVGITVGVVLLRILHAVFAGRLGDLGGGRGDGTPARAGSAGPVGSGRVGERAGVGGVDRHPLRGAGGVG